jgi:hypothetical protein
MTKIVKIAKPVKILTIKLATPSNADYQEA